MDISAKITLDNNRHHFNLIIEEGTITLTFPMIIEYMEGLWSLAVTPENGNVWCNVLNAHGNGMSVIKDMEKGYSLTVVTNFGNIELDHQQSQDAVIEMLKAYIAYIATPHTFAK